jgi:hypothetical protein
MSPVSKGEMTENREEEIFEETAAGSYPNMGKHMKLLKPKKKINLRKFTPELMSQIAEN